MWDFYVKYTLPIFIVGYLFVTWLRINKEKKNGKEAVNKAKLFKQLGIAALITFLVISALSYIIINMVVS
ncbi:MULTISPECIES: hypothetical protein [Bacillus amyloliquefaciens group]|uniref:hypothetical protein n=1 Tax=Bacillus amyloliquefaciens group TaxID=1938374 RepID=UPI0007AA71F3|nr:MULTISPECIES: hypothetical protein [Bacillus amyloliquefaciens group]SLB10031.1 Uncharacterised protein [Mycobacteroides abscessus subsp. massiliense]KZE57423.1 hypothetical protein AV542_08165 [Bacillus amyloliquefaciens]MDL0426238.1 hypothetical protein [Bacillus amyloliquefaciens]MDQ8092091.1 hypothetical protein [Bacillus amyloliquefaciens]MDX7896241.1 hypothetical protein [Bacillus velezensis]